MARDLVFTILGIDKGSPAFDKVAKSADDAEKRLSSFGAVGAKALASIPVAALAAGAATAGAFTAVAAGAAIAGAVILHNNEQVATAASSLWHDLQNEALTAAGSLSNTLAGALDRVHGAVQQMAPQFREMFENAGPAVDNLTDGVIMLAHNAMPGFIAAVKSSEPALRGVKSALADVGSGITDFFQNASKGATSSGLIFASTGRIVRDFAGFTGSALAELSNSGAGTVGVLQGFLAKLEGTVLSLAHGALPGLTAAASGFLTAGSGILTIFNALSPILGPLIGQVGQFAVSLKLVDTVSGGLVTGSFGKMKAAIGDAEGFMGKLKAGAGALMSGGLLPLSLAAAGLSFVLGDLGQKQQRAAERQAALTAAFKESKGAIDDNVRATVAKNLADDGLLRKGKDLGISADILTDAWLGNKTAIDVVTAVTKAYQAELEGQGQMEGQVAQGADSMSQKAYDVAHAMSDQSSEVHSAADAGKLYAEALGKGVQATKDMTPAQQAARAEAEKTAKSFDTLKAAMASVSEKGQAVIDILDRMSGKQPDLREATQAWNNLIRSMTKDTDWNSTVDGVQKLSAGLVDARGEIDTTTEAGSKLQDWTKQAQTDFANTAVAMQKAGIPADEMSQKLAVMRQQFIDNAVAQGLPRDAAIRLADAYHLIPARVVTLAEFPSLAQRLADLGLLSHQIRTLPNGYVVVTADTSPAQHNVTKLIQDNNGKVITIKVVAAGTSREVIKNMGGGMPAAAGGMKNSPGGWTLVGEEGPEIVDLPPGANVYDASTTKRMLQPNPVGGSSGGMAGQNQAVAPVTKIYKLTVVQAGNSLVDLQEQFSRMELLAGV